MGVSKAFFVFSLEEKSKNSRLEHHLQAALAEVDEKKAQVEALEAEERGNKHPEQYGKLQELLKEKDKMEKKVTNQANLIRRLRMDLKIAKATRNSNAQAVSGEDLSLS